MVRDADEELKGIPTTIVLVNMANGSRTMFSSLGNKQWPKAGYFVREFASIEGFGWFHFEGIVFRQICEPFLQFFQLLILWDWKKCWQW